MLQAYLEEMTLILRTLQGGIEKYQQTTSKKAEKSYTNALERLSFAIPDEMKSVVSGEVDANIIGLDKLLEGVDNVAKQYNAETKTIVEAIAKSRPELKLPDSVKINNLSEITKAFTKAFGDYKNEINVKVAQKPTLVFPKEPQDAIPVVLVNKEKRTFYDAQMTVSGGGGGGGTATKEKQDDIITQLQVVNSLTPTKFDYIAVNYASATQEVYTYKTGGTSGTTVSTLTVDYTSSAKDAINSVART